jgi:hypothetical protein
MGVWGTRLMDDDLVADIVGDFFEHFNNDEVPKDIRKTLESEYATTIEDVDGGYVFWLALAKAQWDVGALESDVLKKVNQIIEDDIDSKSWLERDASEKDVVKRRESIKNFAEQLKTPREKPKKPKRVKLKDAFYELGDVLVFKTSDGNYSASVVVKSEKQTVHALNTIVNIKIKQAKKPTLQDILKSDVITLKPTGNEWTAPPFIDECRYFTEHRKKIYEQFEVIGTLLIKKDLDTTLTGFWKNQIDHFEGAMDRMSNEKISLKKYLGYNSFKKIRVIS